MLKKDEKAPLVMHVSEYAHIEVANSKMFMENYLHRHGTRNKKYSPHVKFQTSRSISQTASIVEEDEDGKVFERREESSRRRSRVAESKTLSGDYKLYSSA